MTPRADRHRRPAGLAEALDRALAGGPEKYRERLPEQGKIAVRERVERLVDPESFAEEALLANWDRMASAPTAS